MSSIYIEASQSIKSSSGNYYKIIRFLGSGANAYAYRCLCTSGINRGIEFVLKLQYNLSSEMRRERFMREAAFLKTCNHPSILTQYDFGIFTTSKEEFPFIVTNYMPETLYTRITSNSLSSDLKIKFSCQLLSAVAFLQNRDIIHRDIKPSNIFISNENAILGDFGLIKRISAEESVQDNDDVELVNETVMNGFSGYAAMAKYYRTPELVNYANRTDRLYKESDIFQLGLVLAEMFTGKNPLRPSENIHDNIELDRIGYIDAPNGGVIFNTLSQMLELDRSKRISIDLAMDRFTGIYPE